MVFFLNPFPGVSQWFLKKLFSTGGAALVTWTQCQTCLKSADCCLDGYNKAQFIKDVLYLAGAGADGGRTVLSRAGLC